LPSETPQHTFLEFCAGESDRGISLLRIVEYALTIIFFQYIN
jgi:hypothetical protein